MQLNNVSIAPNSRIISDILPFDKEFNRGIRTHNIIGKIFADIFGSGTETVIINEKKYYVNRGSCYKFLNQHCIELSEDKNDLLPKLQELFDNIHLEEDPSYVPKLIASDAEDNPYVMADDVDPLDYHMQRMNEIGKRANPQQENNH